jgi:hypothetical protein
MADIFVLDNNIFVGKAQYVSSFPDTRYVKNAERDYNAIYGVNYKYYPSPYPGHKGLDQLYVTGTPLKGIKGLKVTKHNPINSAHGNHIEIANSKIAFIFSHLNSINANVGQELDENVVFGYTGNTGQSQGPHLHVQCWLAGTGWVDPTPYISGRLEIPGTQQNNVIGNVLPNKSIAYLDKNIPCGIIESGIDNNRVVTRILLTNGTEEVVFADRLTAIPFAEIGRIVGLDSSIEKMGQIIEYGQDNKGTVARVRWADKTETVVYAFRLIPHLPNFVQGDIVKVEGMGKMQIETHAFDKNGDKVYRVSTVVYANRVRP